MISPVFPDANGGGREKRAHQWVCHLSARYQVSLLVVSDEAKPDESESDCSIRSLPPGVKDLQVVPAGESSLSKSLLRRLTSRMSSGLGRRPLSEEVRERLRALYEHRSFGHMLVFRLYLQDIALHLQALTGPKIVELDLDDIESVTRFKLGKLLWKRKRYRKALQSFASAVFFLEEERKLRLHYSNVYICSPEDREILMKREERLTVTVMPNRIHGLPEPLRLPSDSYQLLFVGSLSYYPNEEAAVWFMEQVLPKLRAEEARWTLHVVGLGGSPSFTQRLRGTPGVKFHGYVPALREVYKQAYAVISPLHAGGGTKLKVMEAMWFGRPLLASAESVHGLSLEPGVHYLAAETTEDYLEGCRMLAGNRAAAECLAEASVRVMAEKYTY